MEVVFYYNLSDDRKINKNIQDPTSFVGQARDSVDIMSPVILFDSDTVMRFNYAYIPEFERYYSVVNRTALREGLFEISLEVDVLMSFRNDILNFHVIVDKQSKLEFGDEYIDDGSLVTDNLLFSEVIQFPDGFLENPEYILITAG